MIRIKDCKVLQTMSKSLYEATVDINKQLEQAIREGFEPNGPAQFQYISGISQDEVAIIITVIR